LEPDVNANNVYAPETVVVNVPVPPIVRADLVGAILADGADAGDVPYEPVAVTVNVYAVSVVNPLTKIGDDAPVAVIEPGLLVTV
jgi:hypothetical protein